MIYFKWWIAGIISYKYLTFSYVSQFACGDLRKDHYALLCTLLPSPFPRTRRTFSFRGNLWSLVQTAIEKKWIMQTS